MCEPTYNIRLENCPCENDEKPVNLSKKPTIYITAVCHKDGEIEDFEFGDEMSRAAFEKAGGYDYANSVEYDVERDLVGGEGYIMCNADIRFVTKG